MNMIYQSKHTQFHYTLCVTTHLRSFKSCDINGRVKYWSVEKMKHGIILTCIIFR